METATHGFYSQSILPIPLQESRHETRNPIGKESDTGNYIITQRHYG